MLNQGNAFKEFALSFVPRLIISSHRIVEAYLSYIAKGAPVIYEHYNDDDPDWDHSGQLRKTDTVLTVQSEYTLSEISNMYTGDSVPTYCSGYGLSYTTYGEECERLVSEHLCRFVDTLVRKCMRTNLYTDYLSSVLGEYDYNDTDSTSDFITDFSCDELELWQDAAGKYVFSQEDMFSGAFGEQRIKDVATRYVFLLARFRKDKEKYENACYDFGEKKKMENNLLIVPKVFRQKINQTPEDKEIRDAIEYMYTKEELAVLFHYGIMHGSNSYAGKYLSYYKQMEADACGKAPHFNDYLLLSEEQLLDKDLQRIR